MNKKKLALMQSVIALLLCISMLVSTTFAWFTDSVQTGINTIASGNLDVELYHSNAAVTDEQVNSATELFKDLNGKDILWEPGVVSYENLRVSNEGDLALAYQLSIVTANENYIVAESGAQYGLSQILKVGIVEGGITATDRAGVISSVKAECWTTLGDFLRTGKLLNKGDATTWGIVIYWQPGENDNLWNLNNGKQLNEGEELSIDLGIKLVATQEINESDSFGDDYDEDAAFPTLKLEGVTVDVSTENNIVTADATVSGVGVSATIPAGVAVNNGVTTLALSVTEKAQSEANLTLNDGEALRSLDVHMAGVSENNTVPMLITVEKAMKTGLNIGNYTLYHVEDGVSNAMTSVSTLADLDTHNEFYYDPATGDVTLALATFSEVAMVAETENAWNGTFATAFNGGTGTEADPYIIANADQMAYFSRIISTENDTYGALHYKLVSNINFNGEEARDKDNKDLVYYPAGYWMPGEDTNAAGEVWYTYGGSFKGVFDGNGNTISNIYQNTWLMDGDYDNGYWNGAMGIFAFVNGGTVKNLTVDSFSSDGEFTPTGVIAAYAAGDAKFENIAITNCNPRVYNTGNGGIIGVAGSTSTADDDHITLTNITVDNSNKISALWGSWDVACGGLVGMYRGNVDGSGNATGDTITFTNCHVSAQIDVYNDVCANYQYYAYRYAGMIIGSVRHNTKNDAGKSIPNMTGISAEGCTVHFGTWNDYYYCELVANTTASYTHDYQMSRLTEIKAISGTTITYLDGTTGTVPTSGRANYVIVDYTKGHGTDNATCYHFVNGEVWSHENGGYEEKDINGDGVVDSDVLKEDKQHLYLEFNNLFTGYGWGVTSKGVGDLDGVTILDRETGDSVEKFTSTVKELTTNRDYTLGEIFSFVDNGVDVIPGALNVTITNLDENGNVIASFTRGTDTWESGTISFENAGKIAITIQDYYFCTPTTITVEITERTSVEKFVKKFDKDFLYRVGNENAVSLGTLFSGTDVTNGNVAIEVETIAGNATLSYTANATDWTQGIIQFSGTGVVKVTITDNDYCTPTELYLEVIDAVNATTATSATENNVVLLNDIGSGFTVSGSYTVFGNGFTLNYTGDGRYLNNGLKKGIVTVSENGTLDNLRINASIYPSAYLYYSEAQGSDDYEVDAQDSSKTRYYYQLSAVAASGNATISNCYIYGARNNIYIGTGDVTVKDTVLECGTVANMQIQSTSEYTVTLNNVTTIQYQVKATIGDTSAVMLGAGVLVGPDMESNPAIVINGDFKQYNWVTAADKEAVTNSTAQTIIETALDATAFNHTINGSTASNLGIIYLNEADASITNNSGLPYEFETVEMLNQKGTVYSLKGATSEEIYSDYENADRTTVNGDYLPTFNFDLGDQEISYDGSEDTRFMFGDENGIFALYKDGENALTLDLTKLATIYKYDGINYVVTVVCKDSNGNALTASNGVVTLDTQGDYTLIFTVNDNIFYDKDGNAIEKSVERSYSVPLTLTVKAADIKNAEVSITPTTLDGVYTTVNLTDYKLRINFLDCISVTDYDNTGTGTTVDLTSNISSATLTPGSANVFTTAFTITITYTDGKVLTVNFSKISGSSAGTKTATVNTSDGVYFITDGALDNKPTETSSQNICTITSVSFKGNSGSTVTNDTDVTVTWGLDTSSSSGGTCLAEGTLITLADGTKKPVEDLRKGDMVMSFDHLTGEIVYRDVIIVVKTSQENYHKNTFVFDDGTELVTINEHGIFDLNLNKYVNIDHGNYEAYIGHTFVSVDSNGNIGTKKLVDVITILESGYKYDIVTNETLNYVAEDTLSVTHVLVDVINTFDFGADLKYDAEKMYEDIEKYGLYDYSEWEEYCEISVFEQYNIPVMKVGISKGLYTKEYIIHLINTYVLDDSVQIID